MLKRSRIALHSSLCLLLVGTDSGALAQETEDHLSTELELGAIFTGGNTKDENITFKGPVVSLQEAEEYGSALRTPED